MMLIKFLSAVFVTVFGWMWRSREAACPTVSDGRAVMDVTKLKSGDRVVFANPKAGYDHDIAAARAAGLKVGQEYTVVQVDLGDWMCRLRLDGMSVTFNSVQFDYIHTAARPEKPTDHRTADWIHEMTIHQAAVKAEVDRFLDAGTPGTRIIHGPRSSGKTHLAHLIHRERGGIVVVRSANAAADFRQNHMHMFGWRPHVVTAADPGKMRGKVGAVVLDIDRKQYHAIQRDMVNNKVIYLHECSKIRDSLWTTSRDHGSGSIVCASDRRSCGPDNPCNLA